MRFRKLRIAWSVFCAVACVGLLGLWVRSYYVSDAAFMRISKSTGYNFSSMRGQLTLRRETIDAPGIGFYGNMRPFDWVWSTHPSGAFLRYPTKLGFDLRQLPYFIVFPYWAPVLVCAVSAAMPMLIRRRFSLRTLLITLTLTAAVLGLATYAATK